MPGPLRRALARLGRRLRRGPEDPPPAVARLDDVRRRLELLLAALHERPVRVEAAGPPGAPGRLRRMIERRPAHLRDLPAAAWAGEDTLHLPPEIVLRGGDPAEGLARYRLLALGQMQRLLRGTADRVPPPGAPMERDLYLLLESAAADAALAREAPGLRAGLRAERAAALRDRPPAEEMTESERAVEGLLRRLLESDPLDPPPELAPAETPEGSLRRARELQRRLQRPGAYRGLAPVAGWGTVRDRPGAARGDRTMAPRPDLVLVRSGTREAQEGEEARPWDPGEEGEGAREGEGPRPAGDAKPRRETDRPPWEAPPPEPDGAGEAQPGEAAPPGTEAGGGARTAAPQDDAEGARGIEYPEWDCDRGRYRRPGATVVPAEPLPGDEAWAAAVLRANRALVRRTRHQFERLRARRARLYRQRDGEELDLEAWTRAYADRRTGSPVDDRLYADVRPARREISILLLVDISGSTDTVVGNARVIDIEKVALLMTAEALDALGDRYAVLTFSGERAEHVRVRRIKAFDEANGREVRARVSALRPEGYTRLGAAVRHATALLSRQGTAHQLLLLLSDGKPNDSDGYDGRYGIEDSRQAIAEARRLGVFPYCLTVDARAAEYLPRIFGAGHVVLRHPEQLPQALLRVIEQMLRG